MPALPDSASPSLTSYCWSVPSLRRGRRTATRQSLPSCPTSDLKYWLTTATPRGSLHPFGSGQSLNPYANHYSPPFAFSVFSYPLHQQRPLRFACHLAIFREFGGESDLPRSRFCRPECLRAYPFSARLFPGSAMTAYSHGEGEQPTAYLFGLGLPAALAHSLLRGLSTIHICCACGTCLASTPHCGSQRHHISSPTVVSFDEYIVLGASDPVVTCRACPSRQLLAVQQVTARQTVCDKTETSFAALYYMKPDTLRAATRVALSSQR